MDMLHLSLLAASAALVAGTTAGGALLRQRQKDLPLLGHITGGALVVGNAACLLPSTPAWYSAAMVAFTVAGFVWFAVSVVTATPSPATVDARLASRDIYDGRLPARPVPARPALRVVEARVVQPDDGADIEDAEIVDEARATMATPRTAATQQTFHEYGPTGGHRATGSTVVATDIGRYVDTRRTRRAHGTHVRRSHTDMDPTTRFLRLAEAYGIDRGPRSLGGSTHA